MCKRSGNGPKIKQANDPHVVLFAFGTAGPHMVAGTKETLPKYEVKTEVGGQVVLNPEGATSDADRLQAAYIKPWHKLVTGSGVDYVKLGTVHTLSKWGTPTRLQPISAKLECRFRVARLADFSGKTKNPRLPVKSTTF